jgi:HlyD family secretion protein
MKKKYEEIMKLIISCIIVCSMIGCSTGNKGGISASGTIETTEVTVSSKVGGQITRLFVDEGANVKPGDTLALLDRTELDIQLDQAIANTAAAEAQYKLTVKGAREEDIAQAEASLKNAEDDLRRIEDLIDAGSVTQKQLDDARTRHILAKQAYDKLKRGARSEEIDIARARRDQAIAQMKSIKKRIEDSYVLAPVAGVITLKSFEEGEIITQNGSLVRISRLDKVHLVIYVSEEELALIKLGQEAGVYIDGAPNKTFPGKVVYISSIAEFTPKNVQTKEDRTKLVFGVKIEIPNTEQALKPGMPADAVIETR